MERVDRYNAKVLERQRKRGYDPLARPEKLEPEPSERRGRAEGKKRTKLFEQPVTAVIRWMGADGWGFEDTKAVLKHFGVDLADGTIRIQLKAGKNGERGAPASISPKQERELYQIRKKV